MFLILLQRCCCFLNMLSPAAIPEALNMDRTLRIDCIFSGSAREQEISIAELRALDGWAGRRVNLDRPPLRGNGQITLRDTSGNILYSNAFSTLFQEWQTTEEATRVRKSFENVFLVPMPRVKAELTLKLFDTRGNTACEYSQTIDPADILIRPLRKVPAPHVWLWKGGDPLDGFEVDSARKIDVAIVAEGYTEAEMDRFLEDARATVESLWGHEPFNTLKDRFNIVAVQVPSEESGVSIPREGVWKNTAMDSSFDTFYSARYLTTLHLFRLHDALAGIPYEHIICLPTRTPTAEAASSTPTPLQRPATRVSNLWSSTNSGTASPDWRMNISTTTRTIRCTWPTLNPGNGTSRR